jgi:hypothetical protein
MRLLIVSVVWSMVSMSCAFNRTVRPSSTLAALPGPVPLRPVVSGFTSERPTVAAATASEALALPIGEDASGILLDTLRSQGVAGRAVALPHVAALEPGEVLLRGSIRGVSTETPLGMSFISFMSFMTFGGLLPYPAPFTYTCRYEYAVEVVDAEAHLVFQRLGTFDVQYSTLYFGTPGCRDDEAKNRAAALSHIATLVAPVFQSSQQPVASRSPPAGSGLTAARW